MKVADPKQLKVGMKVRFKANGNVLEGKLTTGYGDGLMAKGWYVRSAYGDFGALITDVEIIEGLRAMKVGDIIVDEDEDEAEVLEVLSNTFLLSYWGDFDGAGSWYTFKEAEEDGWKLKDQVEIDETIEVTLEEVAKFKGVDVSKIRIKKED